MNNKVVCQGTILVPCLICVSTLICLVMQSRAIRLSQGGKIGFDDQAVTVVTASQNEKVGRKRFHLPKGTQLGVAELLSFTATGKRGRVSGISWNHWVSIHWLCDLGEMIEIL